MVVSYEIAYRTDGTTRPRRFSELVRVSKSGKRRKNRKNNPQDSHKLGCLSWNVFLETSERVTMDEKSSSVVQLISVPTELEAQLIVNVLGDHDIEAHATGGFISSFRAEAPSEVQVFVHVENLEQAQKILRDRQKPS
jgi:hypothetical protein